MRELLAALSAAPLAVNVGAAALALATRSSAPLVFLAVLLASELLNPLLKAAAAAALPPAVVDRPTGLGSLAPPFPGCSQLGGGGPSAVAGKGMPSGHSQSMGVLVGYLAVAAPHRRDALAAAAVLAVAVMAQRVAVGCHTPLQTLVGAAVGVGLGAGGAAAFAPPPAAASGSTSSDAGNASDKHGHVD